MKLANGWYQVRVSLEMLLDRLFDLAPDAHFEFDSLLSTDEIEALGYVTNFPHLTCLMSSIDDARLSGFANRETPLATFRPSAVDMALLPAACYKLYLHFRNTRLLDSRIVGCIARCFRHEDKALDDYRAVNFTMKEFVCLGSREAATGHLEAGQARIEQLMSELGLEYLCEVASDPFFDSSGPKATLSKLLPTKREIVFNGHAVASLNFHRNYFGDKFNIHIGDVPISTSCIAFGLERWVSMLREKFHTPTESLVLSDTNNRIYARINHESHRYDDYHDGR